MKKITFAIIGLLIMMLPPSSWAHEEHTEDQIEQAIEYRQAIMNVIGWNFKHMSMMVKGELPYDQAEFAAHAAELKQATQMKLMAGFPEDSDESDETDAKPDIWMDWEDFQSKFKDLQKAADQLAKTAGQGGEEATKKQFGVTGKACKSCHKAYKN